MIDVTGYTVSVQIGFIIWSKFHRFFFSYVCICQLIICNDIRTIDLIVFNTGFVLSYLIRD